MQGRIKTREQILSFLNAFATRHSGKANPQNLPFAQEIKYINMPLSNCIIICFCLKQNKTAKIRINDRVFKFLNNIASIKKEVCYPLPILNATLAYWGKHLTKEKR